MSWTLTPAQMIEAPPGRPSVDTPRTAVVVGGGLAGCAAAASLAERGVAVTVLEREAFLGGRVGGWQDQLADGTPFEMERGFHAFFRQYYNLRDFLRRIDPQLRGLTPLEDYPLFGPDGQVESFSGLPRQTPLNLMALVWRTPTLKLNDLKGIPPWPTAAMLTYDNAWTYEHFDRMTARQFLDALNFPPRARQMLFEVFAHSFFNPEEGMSAAEMIRMFHFYFTGNPEGLIFDVLSEPFGAGLWAPMRAHLEGLGVRFELETTASRVERTEQGAWRVVCEGQRAFEADALTLAVTVPALQRLVAASPHLDDPQWRAQVESLDTTLPFVVWRLWLDTPTRPGRDPFVGTAGLGILDNISLYHLFQSEARQWARRTGGSVVELHGYAVPEEMDEAAMRRSLWDHTVALYPELRQARVIEERFIVRRDCPAFAPGAFASRPGVETPIGGVTLAGDFVRLPVPAALMEGAVTSGVLAANAQLGAWGVAGHPIWTVPTRGMLTAANPWLESRFIA